MRVTVRYGWVPPQFCRRTPCEWSGASHISSPSTHLTRGLAARWIFKSIPIHLQTSMSCLRFEPRPHGTAVSLTLLNGWHTL
ncbi:hypothetical protein TNCV_3314361 [Trichonephila clavipes]|nr:hypothetical protein TNCV_3314361 [Trichonephila clavipes]